jgi:hypothetical protein
MLKKTAFHGWNAVTLSTPKLELIAPLDVGPRILSLRRADGGSNLLYEETKEQGKSGEDGFRIRGGHRLWHGPEHVVRTYQTDNEAPQFQELKKGRGFSLTQAVEERTGIQKSISLELINDHSVRLTHSIKNTCAWDVEVAPWALTMMRGGGQSIIPLPPKGEHPRDLLPSYSLVPWDYTDFSMPAWKFFPSFISVDLPKVTAAQKLGITSYPGWSAYWFKGDLFVKHAAVKNGANYPDRGCPFETFAAPGVTELETLGPLQRLATGKRATHVETWGLLTGLPAPKSEKIYQEAIFPAIRKWLDEVV